MITLPTFQGVSARFEYQVELGGSLFTLRFYWSTREEMWYMDILDSEGSDLIDGVKLVPDYFLFSSYPEISKALGGQIILMDSANDPASSSVSFDNFGGRYQLIYALDSELS